MRIATAILLSSFVVVSACGRLGDVGHAPEFSAPRASPDAAAMMTFGITNDLVATQQRIGMPSLWTGERGSLLGDRRAVQRGEILTVVI
jgi:flagellar L-ring protein precursor FlgH